ncbi:Riboflavin synthase [Gammaproteobacteria bacterium]
MFTGIIQAIGEVASLEPKGGDARIQIHSLNLDWRDVALGDSIAVSGVCLTVIGLHGNGFLADVSQETLSRTAFRHFRRGTQVNLEKALTLNTRLGGHLVSGHVDGVGKILRKSTEGRSIQFSIAAPSSLARYIAEKGSICVDGVSLTVNRVEGSIFALNIVPHTLAGTTLQERSAGQEVNLEVDIVARYLERLLLGDRAVSLSGGVTKELLVEAGFVIA